MHLKITKADGSQEYFKTEKLRRSLRRSGASPDEISKVIRDIMPTLHENIRTQEIYRKAFSLLRQTKSPIAARYSLRRALLGLGPTGFPFEKFLARLFAADNYVVKTGTIIEGRCAPHEIDIAAYRESDSFVGEAKFHSRAGIKTDLQVAMYSYARLLDLKGKAICDDTVCNITNFWLITNTKFTSTAEKYAECVGLNLLSWDYPKKNNLHDRIQHYKIYPITVLQGLTSSQISILINHEIIICRDLLDRPQILKLLHLSIEKEAAVLKEAEIVCSNFK